MQIAGPQRTVGFDHDRAFYPAVLIVVASYYVLFAAMIGSVETVLFEFILMTLFVIAAVAGSREAHGSSLVGSRAVQIAKTFGTDVTAVCSTRNADVVRSIGADDVLDYTKDDFASLGQRYDLILATNGNRSILDYTCALSADGFYAMTGD